MIYKLGDDDLAQVISKSWGSQRQNCAVDSHLIPEPELVSTEPHSFLDGDDDAWRVESRVQDHTALVISLVY